MLVNLKEILADAKEKKYAVGAFNCPNLESLRAILSAAEEMNAPVILNHAEIHDVLIPIEIIGPLMVEYAKKAKVPVCVNLDHGTSFEMCMKAVRLGFSSVMFDASGAPYEENVARTQEMVHICHAVNVSVEAELGHIFVSENGVGESPKKIETHENSDVSKMYTDPDMAKDFVERTGVDALAIAFGTAHGIYTVKPVLDLDRITAIKNKVDIPFVMHGGSGLTEEEFRGAIRNGIAKINYYTYMTIAGAKAVQERLSPKAAGDSVFFHDISLWATEAMKENVKEAIRIFSMR
jgi:fructose-bisphosphate aldolase class II